MSVSARKSLASRASNRKLGVGCVRLFFLPFFLVGVGFFFGFTVLPALKIVAAKSWVETPCVIESSKVQTSSSSDGDTYRVDIVYRYVFADREYTSNRYNFSTGSSGGRKSKQAIVKQHPPGTEIVCYVDPKAPGEAVLNRGWFWELAFGGIGLIFALAGGAGLIFAGRAPGGDRSSAATGLPVAPMPTGTPAVLRPKHTPMAKFLGLMIFAVFWNGFIAVFFFLVFFSEERRVPVFVKIILGLFGLIGLGILAAAFRQFLALFNPRVQIATATTMVPLGGEFHFTWTVTGRSGVLRKLRIVLEGAESATYRRGTSNATDRKVFAQVPIFESTEREFMAQGSGRAVVPANSMHTFEAPNNKVEWLLKVTGEIPRWPDVVDEYTITVLPHSTRT